MTDYQSELKRARKLLYVLLNDFSDLGLISKEDIVVGTVIEDEKFNGPCGKIYGEHIECLKATNGNMFGCKSQMKSVKECEKKIGVFDYDLNKIREEMKS